MPSLRNNSLLPIEVIDASAKALGLANGMVPPFSLRSLLDKRDKTRVRRYGVFIVTLQSTRGLPMPDVWLERLFLDTAGVATFFREMSGGRHYVEWQVFDQAIVTAAQKAAADKAGGAPASIALLRSAAKAAGIPVDSFDRFLWIIDDGVSSGGTTPSDSLLGIFPLTPQLAKHEMTHAFGCCPHADQSSYDDYGDPFCVMGKGSIARSFENQRLLYPGTYTYSTSGPGICAPYLYVLGWLDFRANVASVTTAAIPENTGAAIVTISANQGAPPPGAPQRIALALGDTPKAVGDPSQYWIEYRHPSRFDRQINMPVSTATPDLPGDGVVILHEVSYLVQRCSSLHSYVRGWTGAQIGNRLPVPAFGINVYVVGVNAAGLTVALNLEAMG